MANYYDLSHIIGEYKYIEHDDESDMYGIFGAESGFCYILFSSEQEAIDQLESEE